MQKIKLNFEGGRDTILFSATDRTFYSYEKNGERLHQKYGGKDFYLSRSGLSGGGFLEVSPMENDLIEFGFYRTDAFWEQEAKKVFEVEGQPVFGYAPIISHQGIDWGAPFVLSDGRSVAFVRKENILKTLLGWREIEEKGRKMNFSYFNSYGVEMKNENIFFNPDHYRGVDFMKFVELFHVREPAEKHNTNHNSMFSYNLSIVEIGGNYFHKNKFNFFDRYWSSDQNPREIEREIVDGWVGAGQHLYWRRKADQIFAFMEIESENEGEKEYKNYEEKISALVWFSKTIEEWKEYFAKKIQEV